MRRRGNISLKLVAQMLVKAGFDHIITVDLHSKESLGFFDCAIDNLRASPFLIQYVQECVSIFSRLCNFYYIIYMPTLCCLSNCNHAARLGVAIPHRF